MLVEGQPVVPSVRGSEIKTFSTEFVADRCADLSITWQGMDLDVIIHNPDKTPLFPVAIPIRGSGPFPILILAKQAGLYSIQVKAAEQTRSTKPFEIKLSNIRVPADSDKKRARAQELLFVAKQQETVENYLASLKLWQEISDPLGQAYALQKLAKLYLSLKKEKEAADGYTELVNLRQTLNDQRSLLYTWWSIGNDHREFSMFNQAAGYYREALQIARSIKDVPAEASLLYSIGFAKARAGQPAVALDFYEQARKIQHDQRDLLNEARTLNAMGGAYNLLGDQASALTFYQQAIPIFEELKDRYRAAIMSNNVGIAYDDLGQWQEAKNYYSKARSELESLINNDLKTCRQDAPRQTLNTCSTLADTIDNIGELNNSTGDPDAALEEFMTSLPIRNVFVALKDTRGLGTTLSRICYSHVLLGKPLEAIPKCEEAEKYIDKENDPTTWASTETYLGMAHAALGRVDLAIKHYDQARGVHQKTNVRRGEGIALNQIGSLYASNNRFEEALATLNDALKLWRAIRDEDGETIALFNLSKLERDRGNHSAAHDHILKAIAIVENRRAALNSQRLSATYFASKQDYYELAIDAQMNLAKSEKSDAFVAQALEFNERARGRRLLDALAEARLIRSKDASIASKDPALKSALDQQSAVALRLSAKANARTLLFTRPHTRDEESNLNKEIAKLTAEYDHIEGKIRTLNPSYASLVKPQPLNASEIKNQLDDDTLLVEYALGEKRSYAWVVSRESIRGVELPARKQIEDVATKLSEILRFGGLGNESQAQKDIRQATYLELASALSRMILDPIGDVLKKKRLAIVADGALQFIPFQALPLPRTIDNSSSATRPNIVQPPQVATRFLLEDYEIVTLASASVLSAQRRLIENRQQAQMLVAVVADPVFDAGDERVAASEQPAPEKGAGRRRRPDRLTTQSTDHSPLSRALEETGIGTIEPLFFSGTEARSILGAVPRGKGKTALLDFEANRSRVMSPDLSNFQIIHFATHGIVNLKNPQISGLVLSMVDKQGRSQNGYLQMHEIYNLNLPAELVVLSACQTGTGKQIRGEGLIALTRGFMYAGAARLIASLWKVDDAATAELMARFYKEMFTNGKRPAAALRAGQISLSKEKRWKSPYFWAGFVLQGEWR